MGYIEMYVNPEEIRIEQTKISQSTRTKAGFIYQYAGEGLTNISISGTTGSSGIEGINLLEKVYRAEQIEFERIANSMSAQQGASRAASSFGSALGSLFGLGGAGGQEAFNVLGAVTQSMSSAIGMDPFDQPFPTLATLASAVEMNHQGVTYRGYFTNFSSTESAQNPGLFNYTIGFSSYARAGERMNFMAWHRRPDRQSDSYRKDNFSIRMDDPNPDKKKGSDPADGGQAEPASPDTDPTTAGTVNRKSPSITVFGRDLLADPKNK